MRRRYARRKLAVEWTAARAAEAGIRELRGACNRVDELLSACRKIRCRSANTPRRCSRMRQRAGPESPSRAKSTPVPHAGIRAWVIEMIGRKYGDTRESAPQRSPAAPGRRLGGPAPQMHVPAI